MNTTNVATATSDGGATSSAALGTDTEFEEIVGSSEPLRTVLWQVTKVAPMDSTVLITGETGTGKGQPRHPCRLAPPFVSLRERELRGDSPIAHRGGAVRPRARGVHGSAAAASRPVRDGGWRDALLG